MPDIAFCGVRRLLYFYRIQQAPVFHNQVYFTFLLVAIETEIRLPSVVPILCA